MARGDRLTSYDIDITALASATVRDIHVSEGYAWVLTDTHCYRHPVTTGVGSGTALNIALTSGIGDSRRITGDSHHIYIAYSDTSGDPVVNKIEKRSLATPAAVESTFTLAYNSALSNWAVYSGSSALVMKAVANIATDDSMEHLIIHCLSDQDESYSYHACFSKVTGEHRNLPTFQDNTHYEAHVNHSLGSAIDGDDYWYSVYDPDNASHRSMGLKNLSPSSGLVNYGNVNGRNEGGNNQEWGYSFKPSRTPSSTERGLAAYNGVGWVAIVDSTDVSMQAYQFSVDTPSTPLVNPPSKAKVRAVEYWNRNSSTNDRYIFLASDTTRKNLLIPYKPNTGDWDYDNLVALDNTNRVRAISILDDVVYALIEKPDLSTEMITYNLTTSIESASADIFNNSGLYNADSRGVSFAMRSVNEMFLLTPFGAEANTDYRRHRNVEKSFSPYRIRNQTNNYYIRVSVNSLMNLTNSSDDERCFNISNSGNAGSDGDSTRRFHVVYNSDGGWEVWYINDDTPTAQADVHRHSGNWGSGAKVRGKIPENMTFVHNTQAGNQEIIMIPKSVHDTIRVLHITSYAATGSVWSEQTIAQPTPAAGATPTTAPSAPTDLTATTTSDSITLTWTPQGAAATDWEVCIE